MHNKNKKKALQSHVLTALPSGEEETGKEIATTPVRGHHKKGPPVDHLNPGLLLPRLPNPPIKLLPRTKSKTKRVARSEKNQSNSRNASRKEKKGKEKKTKPVPVMLPKNPTGCANKKYRRPPPLPLFQLAPRKSPTPSSSRRAPSTSPPPCSSESPGRRRRRRCG